MNELNRIEERYRDATEDLDFFLSNACENVDNLSLVHDTAFDIVCCGNALKKESDSILRALKLAAYASEALFKTAIVEGNVQVNLGTGIVCEFVSKPSQSLINSDLWIRSFYLNWIFRFDNALQTLCNVPLNLLRNSPTQGHEYRYRYIETLKAIYLNVEKLKLLDAINASISLAEEVERESPQSAWVVCCDLPCLHLLADMIGKTGNIPILYDEAISQRDSFWNSSKRRRASWERYFALDLSGIRRQAIEQGNVLPRGGGMVPSWIDAL